MFVFLEGFLQFCFPLFPETSFPPWKTLLLGQVSGRSRTLDVGDADPPPGGPGGWEKRKGTRTGR